MHPVRLLTLASVLLLAVLTGSGRAEQIAITVDGSTDLGPIPSWFRPSTFATSSPFNALLDFSTDGQGHTQGIVRLSVEDELSRSTSIENLQQNLAASDIGARVQAALTAGNTVIVTIGAMPQWISSRPDLTGTLEGSNWIEFETFPPAPSKWQAWEDSVYTIVKYFYAYKGFQDVLFEFWNEPDVPFYYQGSQSDFFEMWRRFWNGARRLGPDVKIGGPAVSSVNTILTGTQTLIQSYLDFSGSNSLPPDFITFHFFSPEPVQAKYQLQSTRDKLVALGWPNVPIIIDEEYIGELTFGDPSWPVPPSATGRQGDSEMAAGYALGLMAVGVAVGQPGGQCQELVHTTGTTDFAYGAFGTRSKYRFIRKANYWAHILPSRLRGNRVPAGYTESNSNAEYFPHFGVLASRDNDQVNVLMWNFVSCPSVNTNTILTDKGYTNEDFARWTTFATGIQNPTAEQISSVSLAFYEGSGSPSNLTSDPQEQADLAVARANYQRRQQLVTESHAVTVNITGFASANGYTLSQAIINWTCSNAYAFYAAARFNEGKTETEALDIAAANQNLFETGTTDIATIAESGTITMEPYSVRLLTFRKKTSTTPLAPFNLLGGSLSSTRNGIRWNDGSNDETGFEVERRSLNGSFSKIATLAANTISYVDFPVLSGSTYTYRVRAVKGTTPSAYSNEDTIKTLTKVQEWRFTEFAVYRPVDAGANDADPDFDGISNLVEYAIGSDPTLRTSGTLPTVSTVTDVGQNYLQIRVQRAAKASGIAYDVGLTNDFSTWRVGPPYTVTLDDSSTLLRVRAATPILSATTQALRLQVRELSP